MLYQKINIIARHVESHFFISLYQPSFSVDYFDFDTKIEAFLFIHPFLGINYKQSTYIPTLLKAHLIEALQSKTSSKINFNLKGRKKLAFAILKKTIQHFALLSKLIREMSLFWNSIFSKSSYKKKNNYETLEWRFKKSIVTF